VTAGAMLGIFVLGMTVPWINAKVSDLFYWSRVQTLLMKSLLPLANHFQEAL
jgi:hypothetical protein